MTSEQIKQVREATEEYSKAATVGEVLYYANIMRDYILSTIPTDFAEPVTVKWLSENYSGEAFGDEFAFSGQWRRFLLRSNTLWQGRYVFTVITTRYQFCQLAAALGIPKKGKS